MTGICVAVNTRKLPEPIALSCVVVKAETWLVNKATVWEVLNCPKLRSLSATKSLVWNAATWSADKAIISFATKAAA